MASAEKMVIVNAAEQIKNDEVRRQGEDTNAVSSVHERIDLDVMECNDTEMQQAIAGSEDDADSTVAVVIDDEDEENEDDVDVADDEGKSEKDDTEPEHDNTVISIEIVDSPISPKEEDNNDADLVISDTTMTNVMVVVNEHDPLDLLMPLRRAGQTVSPDSGTDGESDADSGSNSGSGSGTHERLTREERWLLWQKQYDWLFHDAAKGDFAYCVYCDVTVHISNLKYIKQHNLSMYHTEREKNYLAFKASREQLNESLGLVEIKQEYGTDSRIAALKMQRAAQAEALNNFNWLRWMQAHEWLVRENDEGTIGYCKYCKTRLNVEFSYLRDRHAKGKGHLDLEQAYKKREAAQKQTKTQSEQTSEVDDKPNEEQSNPGDNDDVSEVDEMSFAEVVANTSGAGNVEILRCTLCDTRISRPNFRRHLRSKLHISNMESNGVKTPRPIKEETSNVVIGFEKYVKQHSWISADPEDASHGYCTVCKKRIVYPHSEAKRILHENSLAHRNALDEINKQENNSVDDDKDSNEEKEDSAESDSEDEDGDEENAVKQSRNPSDKSSATKFKRPGPIPAKLAWCKPYGKDSTRIACTYCNVVVHVSSRMKHEKTQKHQIAAKIHGKSVNRSKQIYHWIGFTKNGKISYCKYCHVRFTTTQARASHARSNRHMLAMKQLVAKHTNKKKQNQEATESADSSENESEEISDEMTATTPNDKQPEATVANTPTVVKVSARADKQRMTFSIHSIVQKWNSRFPWLTYKRAETRPHYGWCKLCETSFYVPSYKFVCKHQRSSRHHRFYREWKRGNAQKKNDKTEPDEMVATSETKESPGSSVKNKAEENVTDFEQQFSWCETHVDDNFVHCRICKIRLAAKLFIVRQHDASRRHLENVRQLAELNDANEVDENNENEEDDEENMQQENQNIRRKQDEDAESTDEMSVRADSTIRAVHNFVKRARRRDSEEGNEPEPNAKRARHSSSAFENLDEATRQKLVRALRRLKSSQRYREESSPLVLAEGIISSSFNIAACLTPLIQQQQQQQQQQNTVIKTATADVNKTPDIPVTEPTPPKRDTIDLFFESIMQTVRNLPADLITEAKWKIMQTMCELELRALNRQKETENKFQESSCSNEETSMQTNNASINPNTVAAATQQHNTTPPIINSNTTTATGTSSSSSTTPPSTDDAIIIDDFEELIRMDTNISPYTTITNVATNTPVVRTPSGRFVPLPNGNNKQTNSNHNHNSSGSGTINPKANNESMLTAKPRTANDAPTTNILRMPASTTVQISTRNEATGSVRCVPLNTLTALVKNPDVITTNTLQQQPAKTSPVMPRVGATVNQNNTTIQVTSSNINTSTPRPIVERRSSICSVTPRPETNDNLKYRQIRVNTTTQSKYITVQSPNATTMAPSGVGPTQMRLSNGTVQQIRPHAK